MPGTLKLGTLINLVLATLWLAGALAVVVVGAFVTDAAWLARIHQAALSQAVDAPAMRLQTSINELQQGNSIGQFITETEQLALDLEHIQREDMLGGIRGRTYSYLVWAHQQNNDLPAAFNWTVEWRRFDPRSIDALASHAHLKMLVAAMNAEGESEMNGLADRFPHAIQVADTRATAYAQTGDIVAAFEALEPFLPSDTKVLTGALRRHIDDPVHHGTTVNFYRRAAPLAKAHRTVIDNTDTLILTGRYPGGFDLIDLRPPPHLPVTLKVLSVTFNGKPVDYQAGFNQLIPQANGSYLQYRRFRGVLQLQSNAFHEGGEVVVRYRVSMAPTETMRRLYSPELQPEMKARLKAAGRHDLLRRYEAFADAF